MMCSGMCSVCICNMCIHACLCMYIYVLMQMWSVCVFTCVRVCVCVLVGQLSPGSDPLHVSAYVPAFQGLLACSYIYIA